MAKLFPNKLSGQQPPAVLRVHRHLKKLSDAFSVWFTLAKGDEVPHFLVLWENRCAFIVQVAETSQALAESAIQGNLFQPGESISIDALGERERKIISQFTEASPQLSKIPLKPIIVFPNVSKGTLDSISAQRKDPSSVPFLSKQDVSPEKLTKFFTENAPAALQEPQVIELRHHFSLEVYVPQRFSPLQVDRQNLEATLTPTLLDLDQEWCMKNNLYLPDEQEAIVENIPMAEPEKPSGPISQLVTGVAGSGKSLILLYRALLNAQLNHSARVLVLTHNRPINNELQARFRHLSGKAHQVTWLTFFAWARQQLNEEEWPENERVIFPDEALKIIRDLTRKSNCSESAEFLLNEFGFIKDHNIRKLSEYLETSRSGQGKALQSGQRKQVWSLFKDYQKHLRDHHITDWHNIAIRFHDKAMAGNCSFPQYHCILIDEAQFFAKSWFDIVRKALIPGGQLFLAADPTQGFLKRRQSWISSGIDVRGRTTKLAKPYRNSREILTFATRFYIQRQLTFGHQKGDAADPAQSAESEELNLLSETQISQAPSLGIEPSLKNLRNEADCHQQLLVELESLANRMSSEEQGHSILILHSDGKLLNSLQEKLENKLPALRFHNTKRGPAPPNTFAQFATLNAATGLEASVVFLLGVDAILEKESSPLLAQDERDDLIAQNTKQLYMAFTRAAQKLVIYSRILAG